MVQSLAHDEVPRWCGRLAASGVGLAIVLGCAGLSGSEGDVRLSQLCRQACSRAATCSVQTEDDCLATRCSGATDAELRAALELSCGDLHELLGPGMPTGGGAGRLCASEGVDDCPGIEICCAPDGGRSAASGEPGTCMVAGVCNAPR